MKKVFFSIFFILLIGFIFTLSESTTDFWKLEENRSFIVQEALSWLNNYSFILDWLNTNISYIAILGLILLIGSMVLYFYKHKKKQIKDNPLTGGKTIVDGSSIISAGSLPESEKKREEKKKKLQPFISKEMISQKDSK